MNPCLSCDARLENGARVNAVIRPVALEWTDSYNTKVSGYTDHNGEADRSWQSSCRNVHSFWQHL